jgi:2,4-dienoyl-CoA reductase (NADPH2)
VSNDAYRNLLRPFRVKGVELKNRIVKPGQWTVYAEADGSIGDRLLAYYEDLARGGVGLITVEESVCDYPLGASRMPHIRLDDDRFIPGLARLAEAVHRHGCPLFIQVTHAGPAHSPVSEGERPVAPSALEAPVETENVRASPRALTIPEIKDIVEKYAQAARRVRDAGFDGAEMHMAHYALGNAFLSRIQNRRSDEYGAQTLASRAKFNLEILTRTREVVGPAFVMGVRMNSREWGHELGTTLEEGKRFAKMFEQAGADYLQVSAYGYGAFALAAIPDLIGYPEPAAEARAFAQSVPRGALIPDAAAVKQAVSIPVSGVGHVEPEVAESILEKGLVDLICFGRPLLADPHWPRKLMEGKLDEIRPCMRCNVCLHHILLAKPLRCRMNPYLGNETTMVVKPAARRRKVMVVGAGPSGLEAARIATERGHELEVYDRGRTIGGLMPLAIFIKGTQTDNMQKAIDYYRRQMERLAVPVHLRQEVDASLVQRVAPDVLVLAVGGKPIAPTLPIEAGSNVLTTDELRRQAYPYVSRLGSKLAGWLTKLHIPVGERVLIVGGDLTGLETAEWLVKRGRVVTVVEESESLGRGLPLPWLSRLLPWLGERGAKTYTRTIAKRATRDGLEVTNQDGEHHTLEADTIVLVSRYGENNELYDALKGRVPEVHRIGDAQGGEPGYVLEAIQSGAEVGIRI